MMIAININLLLILLLNILVTSVQGTLLTGKASITAKDLKIAFDQAEKDATNLMNIERNLIAAGGILPKYVVSAESRHQGRGGTQESSDINKVHFVFQQATKALKKMKNLNDKDDSGELAKVNLTRTMNGTTLAALSECRNMFQTSPCHNRSESRTADGSCNNLVNPTWGRANTCLDRLLPASYNDGVEEPRKAVDQGPLPNPRKVSTTVHTDSNMTSQDITMMTMLWGQFLDHDVTLTPMIRTTESMEMLDCCDKKSIAHPDCWQIEIPSEDSFYGPLNRLCLNFVRSQACNSNCKLGPRDPVNVVTAYIDGSVIYGSDHEETSFLRSFRKGGLRVSEAKHGHLLPRETLSENSHCTRNRTLYNCFRAGDERVNEHPALTFMHTVWMRHHNRIAGELTKIYRNWTDEIIFQRTRQIVIAQIQHITYQEFLPVILGRHLPTYNLASKQRRSSYNPRTNPAILTEFSTAAYRFGHTLIQNLIPEIEKRSGLMDLSENFFNQFAMLDDRMQSVIKGIFSSPAQQYDRHIVSAVTNNLYKVYGSSSGLDLIAINIQRGRDHGLQGYTEYVKECLDIKIEGFHDLSDQGLIPKHVVDLLDDVYGSVKDIDLFTGGICELKQNGAVIGPTFACIIGRQFSRLKYGDRFFYEHGNLNNQHTFTDEQLSQIRQTTLAEILCHNTGLPRISTNVFRLGSLSKNCSRLPGLNLTLF